MKKFKITSIILLLSLVFSMAFATSAFALDDPPVESNAVALYDIDTGNVLYTKNADVKAFPASTTKILTVLLAIEATEGADAVIKLTDNVTATANMTADLIEDGSSAGIQVGETMTLEQLLYCALLSSGNDACNVIAEYVGGSISGFVEMMNQRVQELGCTGTHFANPHGIPSADHYTTAQDLARIGMEAARNTTFMSIANTAKYTVPATNMSEARTLSNSNALINTDSMYGSTYKYEAAAGIKTGHTAEAGYCLVSTASKDGKNLLAVVLGGVEKDSRITSFTDSIALYNWGFDNFSFQEVLRSTDKVAQTPVSLGENADYVSLRPQSSITLLLPTDTDLTQFTVDTVIYSERDNEELVAPISAGEVLGEVTVSRDGQEVGRTYLVASGDIDLSRVGFIKAEVKNTLSKPLVFITALVIVVLFILYLVWVILYRIQRRRHLRAVRAARKARETAAVGARTSAYAPAPTPEKEKKPSRFARRKQAEAEEPAEDSTPNGPVIEFHDFDDEE